MMDKEKIIGLLDLALIHMNNVKVEEETNLNNQLVAIRKTKEAKRIIEEDMHAD